MAVEWGQYGVRVNGVSGGPVDTRALDWFRHPAATRRFALEKSLFKRLAVAEDLAPVVAFLCTEDARWITGQTIVADGGMTIGMDRTEFNRDELGNPL